MGTKIRKHDCGSFNQPPIRQETPKYEDPSTSPHETPSSESRHHQIRENPKSSRGCFNYERNPTFNKFSPREKLLNNFERILEIFYFLMPPTTVDAIFPMEQILRALKEKW